jgi:hypothetical protein
MSLVSTTFVLDLVLFPLEKPEEKWLLTETPFSKSDEESKRLHAIGVD